MITQVRIFSVSRLTTHLFAESFSDLFLNSFFKKSLPPDVLVSMGIEMAYTFGMIFFFCEMCEQITDGFNGITDEIKKMDWYSYPLEIQRMLPIILIHGQEPVEIVAFGNIQFTRETFKRVIEPIF